MSEQTVVASTEAKDFEDRCYKLMKAGWRIIQGTSHTSTAATNQTKYGTNYEAVIGRTLVAFFER